MKFLYLVLVLDFILFVSLSNITRRLDKNQDDDDEYIDDDCKDRCDEADNDDDGDKKEDFENFEEDPTKMINMCGLVGQTRPKSKKDCTEDSLDFGGECCFVTFKGPKRRFRACLIAGSLSNKIFSNAEEAAEQHQYSVSIICESNVPNFFKYTLLLFIIYFL